MFISDITCLSCSPLPRAPMWLRLRNRRNGRPSSYLANNLTSDLMICNAAAGHVIGLGQSQRRPLQARQSKFFVAALRPSLFSRQVRRPSKVNSLFLCAARQKKDRFNRLGLLIPIYCISILVRETSKEEISKNYREHERQVI